MGNFLISFFILILIDCVLLFITTYHLEDDNCKLARKYRHVRAESEITVGKLMPILTEKYGYGEIPMCVCSKEIWDRYNPRVGVFDFGHYIRKSDDLYHISKACHEMGHAIQHREHPHRMRWKLWVKWLTWLDLDLTLLLTVVGFAGVFLNPYLGYIAVAGTGYFVFCLLLRICSIPLEAHANKLAMKALGRTNLFTMSELMAIEELLKVNYLSAVVDMYAPFITYIGKHSYRAYRVQWKMYCRQEVAEYENYYMNRWVNGGKH